MGPDGGGLQVAEVEDAHDAAARPAAGGVEGVVAQLQGAADRGG